jgi:hypothetical protein
MLSAKRIIQWFRKPVTLSYYRTMYYVMMGICMLMAFDLVRLSSGC